MLEVSFMGSFMLRQALFLTEFFRTLLALERFLLEMNKTNMLVHVSLVFGNVAAQVTLVQCFTMCDRDVSL